MKLHLVDVNDAVVQAWRRHFAAFPEVTITRANILDVARHAVVSPGNSQGFMDGGIDRDYAALFGPTLTRAVRDAILARPEGHLPVGAALAVPVAHERIRFLIVAPTMTTPEHVPRENAYRALRAVLRLCDRDPVIATDVFCPGLTTLVGGVDPDAAALEMADAYRDWTHTTGARSTSSG